MSKASPQVDLFPETVADVPLAVKKGRGKGRKVKSEPARVRAPSLPLALPLIARPLLGSKGATLLATVSVLLVLALVEGLNLLWHQGVVLTAVMLVALVALLGGFSGYRLWREWRAVIALNAVLDRRAVVDAVLKGAPLADRQTFCLNLLPLTRHDERYVEAAEQWLAQRAESDNDAELLRAFIHECVVPAEAALLDELFENGPTQFLSGSSWLVHLANIKRTLQLTDTLLRGYQIDSAWFVRWRLLDAASSHLAAAGGEPSAEAPCLRWLANTLQRMLAAPLIRLPKDGHHG